MPEEIAIYEDFFEFGFRGYVPSLIVSLCNYFHISPSQLNPPAWRILMAIQNLGDEEGLALGVSEVLFAYHLAPINGHEGLFHLRPRSGLPIVEELPKTKRKGLAFAKKWLEIYVFMTLPGSHYRWNFGTYSAPVEGEGNVLQARKLPLEQRRVPHLLSLEEGFVQQKFLWRWNHNPGNKRRMIRRSDNFFPSRGGKPKEGVSTRSQRPSLTGYSSGGLSGVLANLNANVFAWMQTLPLDKDPPGVIQQVQGELLQVLSHLHHLKDRIVEEDSSVNRGEVSELSRQLSEEKSRRVAKELELRDLQAKIRAIEGSVETTSAESLQLSREKQELEETIVELQTEAETSKNMMTMVVNGARIIARLEVMREWLKRQAHKWNLSKEFSQYITVVLAVRNSRVPILLLSKMSRIFLHLGATCLRGYLNFFL
ncbi:Uncharacterized protein Rs2_38515 [Raphanus sativus]|nr:Uncharacterized protein Rs2_38515 [Raphanus sativus]